MNFRVGQKVVCVDESERGCWSYPAVNAVYTVRGLDQNTFEKTPNVWLVEITNQPMVLRGPAGPETVEPSFRASRFRPAVERKTDISIFTRMLNDKTVEVVR